jgi:hypothetical protein
MTRFSMVAVILAVALSAGLVVAREAQTTSDKTIAVPVLSPATAVLSMPETENHADLVCEAPVKKCGFDSECKGHGKCSSGKCTKSPYK